jgi:hypothetical protein
MNTNPLDDIWITVLTQMLRVARKQCWANAENRRSERVNGMVDLIIATLGFPKTYAFTIEACVRTELSVRDTIKHIESLRRNA